ncbi:MAG TPA: hypothetical protein VGO63_03330 [Candidatus Paceibacterota bacterium]|jgi:hypothetical protein|nr:hypothetical protein [Candidatus Paceibacterota bacterium]
MLTFTKKEKAFLKKLNTPAKVQDFLNGLKFNFEKNGADTFKSPLFVIRKKNAHCIEGAVLGAYILSLHGFTPYVLHLQTTKGDFDHVVTPFKVGKYWGALSKTNHGILRYREPIYKNVRELAMSYFHEYFLDNGKKTLRKYSAPLNLNTVKLARHGGNKNWASAEGDLWYIDHALDKVKHYDIVPKNHLRHLRKADKVEIKAGKVVEYKKI